MRKHSFALFLLLASMSLDAMPARAGRRSAVPSETITLPNLQQPVEILIDRWGVPHIYARNEADLFFAQGFNAARDRLFQIDLWRRRGLGQLSEVFGPAFIDQDKATRLFLYRGDMNKEWAAYGPSARQIAENFVAGINAYIGWLTRHPERTPWEFKRLSYTPAKWSAEDVVRIRSHGLTRNLDSEVARARVVCAADLPSDEIRIGLQPAWRTQVPPDIDPCLPKNVLQVLTLATQEVHLTPEALKAGADPVPVVETAETDPPTDTLEGSNNWVIAPAKSATGHAIMANDPHRAYSEPSLRYISHLDAPTLHVIGANEPALPGVSLGHNDSIAFGYTIFPIDQEDLYIYQLNPSHQYKYQDGWEPFRVVREEIKVKGQAPVPVDLTFTRHGPVIFIDQQTHRAFALRSAWLEPGMAPYYGSVRYMRAENFDQFKQSTESWSAPSSNLVYADVKGNIGWVVGGLAPIRPNWDGLLPVPGDGRFEWAGRWKAEQLPRIYNPSSGYITTSNEMNLPADYPYQERKLGFEWANGSRHQRISEVISGANKFSIEDSMQLQNDELSIPARRLIALLKPLSSDDPKTRTALDVLISWNARVDADQPASALQEVWFSRHLGKDYERAVLSERAADTVAETSSGPDAAVMLDVLEHPEIRFSGNAAEKRNQLLLTSLRAAYEEMERLEGPDAKQWNWGKLQYNLSEHPFAAIVDDAMRARINVGPIEKNGSPFVPNASGYRSRDFRQMSGPSVRVVVDVGNWDNSRAVNHPGQSGDPDSPHYRDLAPMWRNGQYFPLLYSRTAVENATEKKIRLVPGPAR